MVEIFDLKGVFERIFQNLGINPVYETNQFPVLDPACAVSVMFNGKYLGSFGKVDPKILNNWDIKNHDIYYAGLHLDEIHPLSGKDFEVSTCSFQNFQPLSGMCH